MINNECPFCFDRSPKVKQGKRVECQVCKTNYPSSILYNRWEYSLNKDVGPNNMWDR